MDGASENKDNLKVCVITQSYYRKDGSSKNHLKNTFDMLGKQTYKNFKLFITGDNYQPESEFIQLCNSYKGEIYVHNNNHSCRELNLGHINNYWCYGGTHAAYNSYSKAKAEGYDIAILLDDDDYFFPRYIQSVVDNFTRFPETAFMITRSKYCNEFLPRTTKIKKIFYNNYIPVPCDSVRSASAHNINLIGDVVLNLWKTLIDEVAKMNLKKKKWDLYPADAKLLGLIGKKVRRGELKSLYIPTPLVGKPSDQNMHNIK